VTLAVVTTQASRSDDVFRPDDPGYDYNASLVVAGADAMVADLAVPSGGHPPLRRAGYGGGTEEGADPARSSVVYQRLTEESSSGPLQIGVLTPHATPGPEREFPAMALGCLVERVVHLADSEPTGTAPVPRALTAPAVLDPAVEKLPDDSLDAVAYASTTSAYVIGFDAETAMSARIAARLALPAASTGVAAVRALRSLALERIAVIGAPWFTPELNEFGARYFRDEGFEVVFSRSAALGQDPSAADTSEWTLQHVPDEAEGIFIGGNGFRVAAAIDSLEKAVGRPVLTANQVLLWDILAQTHTPNQVNGYGRLFAHRPSAARRDPSGAR